MKPAILAATILLVGTSLASAATAVTSSNANVRSAPSTTAKVVTTLGKGTRIEIGSCKSGWCELTSRNGPGGFVSQSLIKVEANTAAPVSAQPKTVEPKNQPQSGNPAPTRRP